jgi:ribonuclease Z
MKFELTILGTSAAVPYRNRYLSGQVLNVHDELFLIDCGEGTQFRMAEFQVKKMRINHIFITHLHGDHFFGLFGVLTSLAMNGRREALDIFAPQGLEEIIKVVFQNSYYESPFPIRFHTVDIKGGLTQILETKKLTVYAFPLAHRVPTVGYLFKEKTLPHNILAEKIAEYNIPFTDIKAIKNGADFTNTEGVLIPNSELTTPPPKPRSFAYCSDTAYWEDIIPHIQGVDLLYHEATFGHEMAAHATITGHSTAYQAGLIAQKAEVGQLIIGHFSSRYDNLEHLLAEAKKVFGETVLGIDGQVYSVELHR